MGNLTNTQANAIELTTRFYNHFSNGWTGESQTAGTGSGWQITTLKRASGLISSTASKVDFLENGSISWNFGAKKITLISEKARATEKTIKELHLKALELFQVNEEVQAEQEKPIFKIEIGQRLFLDGYGKSEFDGNAIVYKIEGSTYYTVDVDTFKLSTAQHVRHYSDKFGIGTYYKSGDVYNGSIDNLNAIVENAKRVKIEAEQKQADENKRQADELNAKIEEGKKLFSIPDNAKFVIVADMYQNDSDTMTDYFATSVSTSVILAFSSNEKNSMQELKNACLNFEETAEFYEGGKELEHSEKNTYLPNYFLGSSNWYGWKVNKNKYNFDLSTEEGRNKIYLAVAEGRFYVKEEEEKSAPIYEEVKVEAGEIQLIDYSEKAFAVIGDTKPIKDQLKEIGGKFNFRLSCGAGWIFSKTKLEEVQNLLTN